MGKINVTNLSSFKEFIEAAKRVRKTVKIIDRGIVEPSNRNGFWVMQPKTQVVASVFDRQQSTVFRYQETRDTDSNVTMIAGTDRVVHSDFDITRRRAQLREILVDEGLTVEEGEWTADSAGELERAREKLGL